MENISQNPEVGSFSRYWAVGAEMSNHLNRLTHDVIGAAIEVHRHLGPGLLESAYSLKNSKQLPRSLCALCVLGGEKILVRKDAPFIF